MFKGYHHTPEAIVKIRAARAKQAPRIGYHTSAETKKKLSDAHTGRHHCVESRRKMSEARKGVFPTIESKRKMSRAHMGHYPTVETRQKMSEAFLGDKGPSWKGGRKYHNGYILIYIDRGSYIREHRLIIEQNIGRKLLKSEIVHHADFNPGNNNPDNLVIMKRAEHAHYHRNINNLFEHWVGA